MSEAIHEARRTNGKESERAASAELDPTPTRPLRCAANGVAKSFGGNPILRGVDLEIPEGSFAVLVGPSGCGKSTLLRLVAGLELADAGTITIAGRDVTRLPPRDRDIAMVFQSYALYPHLTVRENLAFGLELRKTPKAEIEKRIQEASAMLGLGELLDRLPKAMSGGQRQRVAMGRAIVRRPNMFLFDEPLSNLDAALRAEVRVDIRRLHDKLGATTLYVTHDQVEAMTLADTLWVLNGGKVEQKGPPLEIYERPRTRFVATFLGSPQMNMLEGALRREAGRLLVDAGGLRIALDAARFRGDLADGQPVVLGVRPNDLGLAKGDADVVGELTIEIVEALGSEAFAHGWLRGAPPSSAGSGNGPSVVARLDSDDARGLGAGRAIPLTVAPSRVHLFDPTSGLSLAP